MSTLWTFFGKFITRAHIFTDGDIGSLRRAETRAVTLMTVLGAAK